MNLGLWNYATFEIGITGLRPFKNWDYGITGPPHPGPLTGPYFYTIYYIKTVSKEVLFSICRRENGMKTKISKIKAGAAKYILWHARLTLP